MRAYSRYLVANVFFFADKLNVGNASAYLESDSIWGILRGLESFSQLLVATPDRTAVKFNK